MADDVSDTFCALCGRHFGARSCAVKGPELRALVAGGTVALRNCRGIEIPTRSRIEAAMKETKVSD